MTDLLLVHEDAYANWVFNDTHPTQGRRFINGRRALLHRAREHNLTVTEVTGRAATRDELLLVHTEAHVTDVLDRHESWEWDGPRADLADLAARFAGGTLVALDALLNGTTKTAIHLPGAKHHAQADHSSGFCVFADLAIAAEIAMAQGKRVAILDIDAHHGDGTENLLFSEPRALTFSIHEDGIFPWTGLIDVPACHVYNRPLEAGANDLDLSLAVFDFEELAAEFQPDLIFVAAGADGHVTDPLSRLQYTPEGVAQVLGRLRARFPETPFLMGGAGGYQPDDWTPRMWAAAGVALAAPVRTLDLLATN